MTLGELIFKYRAEHGLSQRKFADMCNGKVTHGYISMLEKNVNPKTGKPIVPTMDVYKAVADAMRVSLDDLISAIDENSELVVEVPDEHQQKIDTVNQMLKKLTPENLELASAFLKAMIDRQ